LVVLLMIQPPNNLGFGCGCVTCGPSRLNLCFWISEYLDRGCSIVGIENWVCLLSLVLRVKTLLLPHQSLSVLLWSHSIIFKNINGNN
jgi:hypothetical protein